MRPVIFAEPGALVQHNNDTGLLPGDRLIEVNGINVDDKSREEIIDLIKSSASSVTVKVILTLMQFSLYNNYIFHHFRIILFI